MNSDNNKNFLGLGKGSRISIGIVAIFFAFFSWAAAASARDPEIINYVIAVFCLSIAGGCLLPEKIRGYCGDVIALFVIFAAIWFIWISFPDPDPGDNPIKFAGIFGGMAILYLIHRYKRFFKAAPNKQKQADA